MNVETSTKIARSFPRSRLLQWSHVLMNVETTRTVQATWGEIMLQWSHVLMNVETCQRVR